MGMHWYLSPQREENSMSNLSVNAIRFLGDINKANSVTGGGDGVAYSLVIQLNQTGPRPFILSAGHGSMLANYLLYMVLKMTDEVRTSRQWGSKTQVVWAYCGVGPLGQEIDCGRLQADVPLQLSITLKDISLITTHMLSVRWRLDGRCLNQPFLCRLTNA